MAKKQKSKKMKCLITGASRGIGKAFAMRMAKEGHELVLVQRKREAALESELQEAGAPSVETWSCDLNQPKALQELCDRLKDERWDLLFNNAGVLTGGLLEDQSVADLQRVVQVNLLAVMELTHAILPGMLERKKGWIVNNSSVSAVMHLPCASSYAATKAGVLAFTECLRKELKGTGVKAITLVTPGIKTEMFDQIDDLYGAHLSVPTKTISPDEYAEKIYQAVLRGDEMLWPDGSTAWTLKLAKYMPGVFEKLTDMNFRRRPSH